MKTKTIKAGWTVHIQTPQVPNFFIERCPSVTDEVLGKYPICDFPDCVLEEVGRVWTEALKDRAAEMRKYRESR